MATNPIPPTTSSKADSACLKEPPEPASPTQPEHAGEKQGEAGFAATWPPQSPLIVPAMAHDDRLGYAQTVALAPSRDEHVHSPTLSAANPALALAPTLHVPPAEALDHATTIGAELAQPQADAAAIGMAPTLGPDDQTALGYVRTIGPDDASQSNSSDAPLTAADLPIENWDRYKLIRLLGRGGMGSVYKAQDLRLNRIVAIKFIRSGDSSLAMRFLQEARTQAKVEHRNICKVYEVGEVKRQPYIAMQYIDGKNLELAGAAMSAAEKIITIRDVAIALHEAHKLGIVHRDIKPANIMIQQDEKGVSMPVLMDFGLARGADEGKGLTESGALMGTPAYMPPEQAKGDTRTIDRRSDVYSLGATLYELLAGTPPFSAESVVDLLLKVVSDEVKPLRDRLPSVPADLETIVMKCLRKEPNQRYDSAKAFAEDLNRYLDGEPIQGKRVSLSYRTARYIRRNRAFVSALTVVVTTLLATSVFLVRQRIIAQREKATLAEQGRVEAELARQIRDFEWLLRSARQLPLHAPTQEEAIVDEQIAKLRSRIETSKLGVADALSSYALGRGFMALRRYEQALEHLRRSVTYGYTNSDVDYSIGIVLGKKFEYEIAQTRMAGNGDWAQKQRAQLESEYLPHVIAALERSKVNPSNATTYLEGLIQFYKRDYHGAIRYAADAIIRHPWLYEASKLAGDSLFELALLSRDRGNYLDAEKLFDSAVLQYEKAAAAGQSDSEVFEALAEARIRQIEMAAGRGQPIDKLYTQAVDISEKLGRTAPQSVAGYLKRAFSAMLTVAILGTGRGSRERVSACLDAAENARKLQPSHPYAAYIAADCYLLSAELQRLSSENPIPHIEKAIQLLKEVRERNPNFLWVINDLASAYIYLGAQKWSLGEVGASGLFHIALNDLRDALALDPTYIQASVNTLGALMELMPTLDNANDINLALKHARAEYSRCVSINKNLPQCRINAALVFGRAAERLLLAGADPVETLGAAHSAALAAQQVGATGIEIEQAKSLVGFVETNLTLAGRLDGDEAIRSCRRIVAQCTITAPQDPFCGILAMRLDWLEADWNAAHQRRGLPVLNSALASGSALAASNPKNADVRWALAETYYRLARAQGGSRSVKLQLVEAGLREAELALRENPRHARALVVRGKLFLLTAQYSGSAEKRNVAALDATHALEKGISCDPFQQREASSLLAVARALESK